jgi:hypothetical protein
MQQSLQEKIVANELNEKYIFCVLEIKVPSKFLFIFRSWGKNLFCFIYTVFLVSLDMNKPDSKAVSVRVDIFLEELFLI